MPGEVFFVDGHTGFIIPAKVTGKSKPWVWYAPTLTGLPGKEEQWMFDRFLDAGIAIAGIDLGESFGSPNGRKLFTAFHAEMTETRSRGGLMTLSWAAENPDKVAGFAGIYPVCKVTSYPGVAIAAGAYLDQLIRTSRREIGWNAPWFVAQASYHAPGDEASPAIRAAQASLWKEGIALEGPDSDAIKGDLRESGGRGVHFSGPGLREHAARWVDKIAPWLERATR